ncbi:MAG TPA: hypothetical protein VGL66_06480 [Caulobacteraceae bacterium]|jgi:hypothetical protein
MTDPDFAPRMAAARAAKRAAAEPPAEDDAGKVTVRVLPLGDGKIADGSFGSSPDRFGHYRRGDQASLPRGIAQQLEDKGWVEIVAATVPAS